MGVFFDLWTYDHSAGGEGSGIIVGAWDEAVIRTFAPEHNDNIAGGINLRTYDMLDGMGALDILGKKGQKRAPDDAVYNADPLNPNEYTNWSVTDPDKYSLIHTANKYSGLKALKGLQVIPKFLEATALFFYLLLDRLILSYKTQRKGTLSFFNWGESFAIVLRAVVYCTFGLAYRAIRLFTSPMIEIWNPIVKMWDNLSKRGAWFTGYNGIGDRAAAWAVTLLILGTIAVIAASIITGGILPGVGALAVVLGNALGSAFWAQVLLCVVAVPVAAAVVPRVYNDMREYIVDVAAWFMQAKGFDETVRHTAVVTAESEPLKPLVKYSMGVIIPKNADAHELSRLKRMSESTIPSRPILIKTADGNYFIYTPLGATNGKKIPLNKDIMQKWDTKIFVAQHLNQSMKENAIPEEVFRHIEHLQVPIPALQARAGGGDAKSVAPRAESADPYAAVVVSERTEADPLRGGMPVYEPNYTVKDSRFMKSAAWSIRAHHLPAMLITTDNPYVMWKNQGVSPPASPDFGAKKRVPLKRLDPHTDIKRTDEVGPAEIKFEPSFTHTWRLGTGLGQARR